MPIANYSTSVSVAQTMGEITGILVGAGARGIQTEFDGAGKATSIAFRMEVDGAPLCFRLPADWRGVQRVMQTQKCVSRSMCADEQAQRVAWRIVRDWTRAQVALVQAGCAKIEQVMLPYLLVDEHRTLFDAVKERKFTMALPAPKAG